MFQNPDAMAREEGNTLYEIIYKPHKCSIWYYSVYVPAT